MQGNQLLGYDTLRGPVLSTDRKCGASAQRGSSAFQSLHCWEMEHPRPNMALATYENE